MSSPCGGCPPHCKSCVFSPIAAAKPVSARMLMSKEDYGCIRPDGGAVVIAQGQLGMLRGGNFHPITTDGAAFLKANSNPLAAHC